jgi:hypothetical protein
MPKPGGATYNLGNSSDALLVHLIGGELAFGFEGVERMMKNSMPCSFQPAHFMWKARPASRVSLSPSTSCPSTNKSLTADHGDCLTSGTNKFQANGFARAGSSLTPLTEAPERSKPAERTIAG